MRTFRRNIGRVALVVFGLTVLYAIRLYYFDGRAPEPRPDLVRLPSMPEPPVGYPTRNALYLAYQLGRLDLVDVEDESVASSSVTEEKDVEYGRVGERALVLDLYNPAHLDHPVPGILFIHGGGWRGGDKKDYRIYARYFAAKGYVVASVGYRLKKEAKYPAAIEDTKCAVRWMRANARTLNVDSERNAAIGGSAGGHLAMMIGYSAGLPELEGNGGWPEVSSGVCAVVNLYGPVDVTTPYGRSHETVTSYIGKSFDEAPQLYRQCSPLFHLDAGDPPTLVIQGTLDDLVPIEQADRLAARLEELKIPYWYDRLDGWPHTMDLARPIHERVKLLVSKFFRRHLHGATLPQIGERSGDPAARKSAMPNQER